MAELVDRITKGLRDIELPALTRPSLGPHDPPTLELVRFDLCYYVYSAFSYVRDLFAGLAIVKEHGNDSCGEVLARSLYEWTMQASYVFLQTRKPLSENDLITARGVLERLETANGWIRNHGAKYGAFPEENDIPGSVRIGKFRKAYSDYCLELLNEDTVEDDYGYLSEHAHPNSACFLGYRRIVGRTVSFLPRPASEHYRGIVTATGLQWLLCIHDILKLAGEMSVRPKLAKLLNSLGGQ